MRHPPVVRLEINLEILRSSVENNMRSKLLGGVAALALTAATVMASAGPASARDWHGHGGFGLGGAIAAGVIGGALAATTSPYGAPGYGYYDNSPGYAYDNNPGYAYAPGYGSGVYDYAPSPYVEAAPVVVGGGDPGYCAQRFRSYDPASGSYLGFDGLRHPCP